MENTTPLWYVYTLTDPRTGVVRYVGWSGNPKQRLNAHCSNARRCRTYKYHWLRQLLDLGMRPVLEVVETGTGDWAEAERRWIAHFRTGGFPLTNLTDGGEGAPGYRPTEETRRKMSAAHVGKKQSAESIAKTRAAIIGRKQSPEHIAKLSAARKGKSIPVATVAAAAKNRGTKQSSEHIAKRIAPHIGKRSASRKLSDYEIRAIRSDIETSLRKLAARYAVGQTTIFKIRHGLFYREVYEDPNLPM